MNSNVTFHDDDFNFDPAIYAAATTPRQGQGRSEDGPLPAPGYYTVRVVSAGLKMDKETGAPIVDSSGKAIFTLNRIEVLEPEEAAGSFKLFQTLYTNGFYPKNWKTGEELQHLGRVYEFMSCLMAIDRTAAIEDGTPDEKYNANVAVLQQLFQTKPTMTVRLTYKGTDRVLAQNLINSGMTPRKAYKQATLNSRAFKNPDGTYRTQTPGVNGDPVMAELKIGEFVPEGASVTLGALIPRLSA